MPADYHPHFAGDDHAWASGQILGALATRFPVALEQDANDDFTARARVTVNGAVWIVSVEPVEASDAR